MRVFTLASDLPPVPSDSNSAIIWWWAAISSIVALASLSYMLLKFALPRYVKETAGARKTPTAPPPPTVSTFHDEDRRMLQQSLTELRDKIDTKFTEIHMLVNAMITKYEVALVKYEGLAKQVEEHRKWLGEQTGRFDVPAEHPQPRGRRNTPPPRNR